jgi:hypothetical protein
MNNSMMKKLFDYLYQYDYGHEAYLGILLWKRFNVFEANFRLDEEGAPGFSFSIEVGMSGVLGVYVRVWRAHLGLGLLVYNPIDLDWYR